MTGKRPRPPERRGRVWLLVAALVVVPTALYAATAAVPFLPLATGTKVALASAFVVAAETVFWITALLVGREVVARYRRCLDPRRWFGRG